MLSDDVVFSVDEEEYRWRDVIVAAVRWGEWHAAEQRSRRGAAALKHADATGEALRPGALETASREFRYERDLVTALSMEQWLAQRGVSARDWTNYLKRVLCRARWQDLADSLVSRYPLGDEEAARLTLTDAIFSGDIDRWSKALAARVAAVQSIPRRPVRSTPVQPPAAIASLLGVDAMTFLETSRRLHQIDEAFEQFRANKITEPALQDYVASRQLDWVRFDCRSMAFPQADMAAEAALMLREDGEGFTGVYAVAHTAPRLDRFYCDHIDAPLRDQFLAARTGDLVGPARVDNEYVLYLIQAKVLPTVRDPEVRRRAEEGVLEHALSQQLDRRVRWHVAP
jgi:hypothetical protein